MKQINKFLNEERFIANVYIVRHQGYIKSKMRFPFQHNFRMLKHYGNKSIDTSLTHLTSSIVKKPLKIKGFRKHEMGFEPVTTHQNIDK